MTWKTRYIAPDLNNWQGRADAKEASCFFQIIQPINLLTQLPPQQKEAFGLLGFCCDEGIKRNLGRVGAATAPDVIRQALGRLPVQKTSFHCYDLGNITCTDGDLEKAQLALAAIVDLLLQHHIIPIVLGGGHEVAFGHYQGIAKNLASKQLGIVNFDAHFDMRPLLTEEKGSSGTPFLQIANAHQAKNKPFDYNCIGIQPAGNTRHLFETAKQHHVHYLLADELQNDRLKAEEFIARILSQNAILYVSLCLDVFSIAYAPGVSAPQTLGLTPWQVIPLLRELASSGKVISYDIAELSPPYDTDSRTAKLAASLIYEIIHHHSLKGQFE